MGFPWILQVAFMSIPGFCHCAAKIQASAILQRRYRLLPFASEDGVVGHRVIELHIFLRFDDTYECIRLPRTWTPAIHPMLSPAIPFPSSRLAYLAYTRHKRISTTDSPFRPASFLSHVSIRTARANHSLAVRCGDDIITHFTTSTSETCVVAQDSLGACQLPHV
jgi:hypothetical protein